MTYIIGYDLGTTAIKVSLFDEQGNLLEKSTQEYELSTPSPRIVEQEVSVYWDSFKRGLKEVLNKSKVPSGDIKCMGVSAQGETLIVIDKEGNPLRPAIVWLDSRAEKEAEILAEAFKNENVYRRTGQVEMVPTWPAAKILWLKRHESEVFKKIFKFLLIEDYFIYRMTGYFVSEGSLLCSTTYWDIREKKWWGEMLDFLGIDEGKLPEMKEPGELIGPIKKEVASELGLSTNTLITTGALDQACGAIGVGNIKPGIISENIGAALAICATVNEPFVDPNRRMPCHYHGLPNKYMAHTFTTGGMVLRWFRDKFCQEEKSVAERISEDSYNILGAEAAKTPPGSEGLIFLPHLQGAMAPEVNPKAKGVLYGFTLRHTKGHVIRAIMESLAAAIRRNIDALEDLGIKVSEIRSLGGGARSRLWSQIKADLTERPLVTTEYEDAACLGAAILAGTATGVWSSVEEAVEKVVRLKDRFTPQEEVKELYRKFYKMYVKLYEDLCSLFEVY
ncbi:FGGY-family carbohydrate kinase [Candidatus Aerophobetes bacterium]|nr:FGGY-family carbohydrate kinase [Candidatus Aerophobetes bacterium]